MIPIRLQPALHPRFVTPALAAAVNNNHSDFKVMIMNFDNTDKDDGVDDDDDESMIMMMVMMTMIMMPAISINFIFTREMYWWATMAPCRRTIWDKTWAFYYYFYHYFYFYYMYISFYVIISINVSLHFHFPPSWPTLTKCNQFWPNLTNVPIFNPEPWLQQPSIQQQWAPPQHRSCQVNIFHILWWNTEYIPYVYCMYSCTVYCILYVQYTACSCQVISCFFSLKRDLYIKLDQKLDEKKVQN